MRPVLNSYVFLKVNEDVEGVMVEEEATDDRYVCFYLLYIDRCKMGDRVTLD